MRELIIGGDSAVRMQGRAASLTDEQNEAVRVIVRRLLSEGRTQTEIAEAAGVTQGAISKFLSETQGTSYAAAIAICKMANEPFAELLGIGHDAPTVVELDGDDPTDLDPRDTARRAFIAEALEDGRDRDALREFVVQFDRRDHSGAKNSYEWWRTAYRTAFRELRSSEKDGQEHPFGVGVRKDG